MSGPSKTWSLRHLSWLTFYPNHESYRAKGPSPLPEDAVRLLPNTKILGGLMLQYMVPQSMYECTTLTPNP